MTDDADAAIGVNDRVGLMRAEEAAQRRLAEGHASRVSRSCSRAQRDWRQR
jgi:bifunctional N-acetylglucosamine-1-phosphate-uridyltransferase/glucosamine-1-phosphate-acetyltransferase GlmU-like protein